VRQRAFRRGARHGAVAAFVLLLHGPDLRPDRLWLRPREGRQDSDAADGCRDHDRAWICLRKTAAAAPAVGRRDALAPPAIGRDGLVGSPQAFRQLAGLPEHVDRDAAAWIPVAADAQPLWLDLIRNTLADHHGAVLVERAVVAEARDVEL